MEEKKEKEEKIRLLREKNKKIKEDEDEKNGVLMRHQEEMVINGWCLMLVIPRSGYQGTISHPDKDKAGGRSRYNRRAKLTRSISITSQTEQMLKL